MIFTKLHEKIQLALIKEEYNVPTAIQKKAIPLILKGKDVIGIAQTGTGKTASFVLPLLQLVINDAKKIKPNSPLVLVLAPTRELVMQIDTSFERFGKNLNIKHKAIFGGVSSEPQIKALSAGIHILTATPGRLLDLISKGNVDLSHVTYIVLDEAHMMLDMGFLPDIKIISRHLPVKKQSLFFSATMTPEILTFANELLNAPNIVKAESEKISRSISQKVCYLYVEKKNGLLLELVKPANKTIVFLRTKYKTDAVTALLHKHNILASAIHSDKTQEERTKAIEDFKTGKIKVLVATDIAARGIDIKGITCVINYDTPNSPDVYIHRIGRTARAGKSGKSYTFCSLQERELLRKIEAHTGQKMEVVNHTYHAAKVEAATPESIAAAVKKKDYRKVIPKRSSLKSDVYVPPINKKKGKKPRGIHKHKPDRRH